MMENSRNIGPRSVPEPCQTIKINFIQKEVNGFKPLLIFAKTSILRLGSECNFIVGILE